MLRRFTVFQAATACMFSCSPPPAPFQIKEPPIICLCICMWQLPPGANPFAVNKLTYLFLLSASDYEKAESCLRKSLTVFKPFLCLGSPVTDRQTDRIFLLCGWRRLASQSADIPNNCQSVFWLLKAAVPDVRVRKLYFSVREISELPNPTRRGGSSVSVVTKLRGGQSKARIPTETWDLSVLRKVQTSCVTHSEWTEL